MYTLTCVSSLTWNTLLSTFPSIEILSFKIQFKYFLCDIFSGLCPFSVKIIFPFFTNIFLLFLLLVILLCMLLLYISMSFTRFFYELLQLKEKDLLLWHLILHPLQCFCNVILLCYRNVEWIKEHIMYIKEKMSIVDLPVLSLFWGICHLL